VRAWAGGVKALLFRLEKTLPVSQNSLPQAKKKKKISPAKCGIMKHPKRILKEKKKLLAKNLGNFFIADII